MRKWTPQSHLEEAFRQELFRFINQYLSFPEDATHGAIVRTLVTFQQVRATLQAHSSTPVMRTSSVESCHAHGGGMKPGQAPKGKFKNCAALMENGIPQGADLWGHASSPVRMTLPLYRCWKSSETETIVDLDSSWKSQYREFQFTSLRHVVSTAGKLCHATAEIWYDPPDRDVRSFASRSNNRFWAPFV